MIEKEMFYGGCDNVSDLLDNWLNNNNNKNITIISVTQSESHINGYYPHITVIIFYKYN